MSCIVLPRLVLTLNSLVLLLAGHAQAQDAAAAASAAQTGPQHIVESTVADRPSAYYTFEKHLLDAVDGRRRYRIEIAIPRAAAPQNGFPVLYMLDGNAAMDTLTDDDLARLAGTLPVVLVAVGYDIPIRHDVAARAFDYTPPEPGGDPSAPPPVVRGRVGGGANIFLDLIQQRIKPLVGARARVDAGRAYLWGHSYGGLFALHTLFVRPDAFSRYIAGDPSAWWNDGALLRQWQAFDRRQAQGKRIGIYVGTKPRDPTRPSPWAATADIAAGTGASAPLAPRGTSGQHAPAGAPAPLTPASQRDAVEKMATGLRNAGAQVTYETFADSDHVDMLRISLSRALQIATEP